MSIELHTTSDWASLDVEVLVGAQKRMFQAIQSNVDDLLALAPVLQEKLHQELGLVAAPDYGPLAASLHKLTALTSARPEKETRRRAVRTKGPRYRLVWKKDGAAVTDEAGKPLAFKNRVQLLRGPRYAALLGPSDVGQVQLVDSQDGDNVVVSQLQLAPAPGRQRS